MVLERIRSRHGTFVSSYFLEEIEKQKKPVPDSLLLTPRRLLSGGHYIKETMERQLCPPD